MVFFLIVCIGWVFSLCLHEFAHAWVAYHGGDRTVAGKGYLTMNPLKYTHPVYSLLLPMVFLALGGIGLPGGAVYIRDDYLKNKRWKTAVSLAGPAASFLMLVVFALPFLLGVFEPTDRSARAGVVALLAGLQATAFVLNLLPVPPLDGFQAISPYLPPHVFRKLMEAGQIPFLLLIVALWHFEPAQNLFWGHAVIPLMRLVRVPPHLFWLGLQQFQFWW